MIDPFYADDTVTLYQGDMREIIPALGLRADLIVADPPYGHETSLAWDVWQDGWLSAAGEASDALWCFGSMRTLMIHAGEFFSSRWTYSQDVVWQKHNGSAFHNDRFRRIHENVVFFYRGLWGARYHEVPTTNDATARQIRRKQRPAHMGDIQRGEYATVDGGPRLMTSVLPVRSMHGRARHPCEKPVALLDLLIRYACPPGGLVLDPFAGSGSTGEAARMSGRRAVLIEGDKKECAKIADRLQGTVFAGLPTPPSAEPSTSEDDL